MAVHTKAMRVRVPGAGQMCHTVLGVAQGNLPAPDQSWETHSFSNVVPVCSIVWGAGSSLQQGLA